MRLCILRLRPIRPSFLRTTTNIIRCFACVSLCVSVGLGVTAVGGVLHERVERNAHEPADVQTEAACDISPRRTALPSALGNNAHRHLPRTLGLARCTRQVTHAGRHRWSSQRPFPCDAVLPHVSNFYFEVISNFKMNSITTSNAQLS